MSIRADLARIVARSMLAEAARGADQSAANRNPQHAPHHLPHADCAEMAGFTGGAFNHDQANSPRETQDHV